MSATRYALGVASLAVIVASLSVAAGALRRRFLPDWTGAVARLAEVVIGLALLIAMLEVLGAVGLFSLAPIVIGSLLLGAGTRRAVGGARVAGARAARASDTRPFHRWAVIPIGVAAAVWAAPTLQSFDVGIRSFDSLWYHLPWAASFAQTGQVLPLRFTDVEYLTAFYPATAEMLHGLGIVALARDTLSPAFNFVWLGLVLLAAYCVGRPRGLSVLTMAGAALALVLPMVVFSQAGSAANDIVGIFFLLAAVALLMNDAESRAAWVLAAVAAGLAAAVKLSLLAPVLALTVGAIAIAPQGRRRVYSALWIGPLVLAGGFWYLRNLIAVGNPLPWVNVGFLATPHPPLQQHTAFTVAHYLTHSKVLNDVFEPGLAAGLGRWWWAIVVAAVIGPLLCLLRGATRQLRMVGFVALASVVAYLLTPESAAGPAGNPLGFAFNLRYAAPALTLSLAILPLAPLLARPRVRVLARLFLAAAAVATLAQSNLWPSGHLAPAIAIGVVAAALTLTGRSRVALAAFLAVAVVGGYFLQRHYLRGRYTFQPGVSYLAHTWAFFRGVHHARVGLVGTFGGFFSYPMYGLDDSNRVQYIAHRGPHGSFTPIGTCAEWRAAVNAGNYRYVVTTPARDPWHPKQLDPSPEAGWTASDPAARVLYARQAVGQPISVFELRGPLDPRTCS